MEKIILEREDYTEEEMELLKKIFGAPEEATQIVIHDVDVSYFVPEDPTIRRAAQHVYETVKEDCCDIDAVYEDYIIALVGIKGLDLLREFNLVEACGTVNGRRLYTLV